MIHKWRTDAHRRRAIVVVDDHDLRSWRDSHLQHRLNSHDMRPSQRCNLIVAIVQHNDFIHGQICARKMASFCLFLAAFPTTSRSQHNTSNRPKIILVALRARIVLGDSIVELLPYGRVLNARGTSSAGVLRCHPVDVAEASHLGRRANTPLGVIEGLLQCNREGRCA